MLSPGADEFQSLFDGKSLDGWKGIEKFWSVQDGTIVGQTTAENPTKGNTFLIWQGGDVADFEFSCEVRFEGNNSGVQYRSDIVDEAGFVMKGYQADLHPKPEYFGMMYGEKLGKRGIIATRHQRVEFAHDESKNIVAEAAPTDEWNGADWNTLRIVAVGNRLVHLVNGVVTVDITDDHPLSLASGNLGLQLHAGPPMKVEFKDLKYRTLKGAAAKNTLEAAAAKFPMASKSSGNPVSPFNLVLAKGFEADLLYLVPNDEQGSWVSLCAAPDGGFYACDQRDKGLYHVSVNNPGGVEVTRIDLAVPGSDKKLSGAQGLQWAMDSLWFHQSGGHLYRITDSDGDGKLDRVEEQPSTTSGGEHGNHAVVLDETGGGLYVAGGNTAPVPPDDSLVRRRVQSWDEDQLLPRMWDPKGHARGRLAPGGWVSRYDPISQSHDLISVGYRNEYDVAVHSTGDLFTFDADMEWDMGSYWYRPTRILFAVSGSDYGWRSGTGKWPAYYEDSLPPVIEVGPGSPTGMVSGAGAKFPEKYQRAIFGLDWTFGTIWAFHLQQKGAGYTGEKEAFVTGAPLPVTDGAIGKDGHFYFVTGGRGIPSGLYRIRYAGSEPTAPVPVSPPTPERKLARSLEEFHGRVAADALDAAWPHLSSEDVFLRHAARVAVESQPVEQWASRVFEEKNPQALITGAVALARRGNESHRMKLLDALDTLDFGSLTERQQLGMLRAYALIFIRLGKLDEWQQFAVANKLDPFLPGKSADVNTELIRVLSFLQSHSVVSKAVELIANRSEPEVPDWAEIVTRNAGYGRRVQDFLDKVPPSREVYYAMMIAEVHPRWTVEARRACIELLNEAAKGSGGASFPGFLGNIRELHLGGMSNAERADLADITGENFNPVPNFEIRPVRGPGQAYTLESASKHLNFKKASFESGRGLFFAAGCGSCHRLGGLGGDVGPDLTSIPNKFDAPYVLSAILDPSKDISSQYQMSEVTLKDGSVKAGLVVEGDGEVIIYPQDHTAEPAKVFSLDVVEVKPLAVSQMLPGLLNGLNPEEVRDLLAYLMSAGDPESGVYGKK